MSPTIPSYYVKANRITRNTICPYNKAIASKINYCIKHCPPDSRHNRADDAIPADDELTDYFVPFSLLFGGLAVKTLLHPKVILVK